jgi:N-acetyl sugar amidotransferase
MRVCSRCICDTSIPGIIFDSEGVCNFCHEQDERDSNYPLNEEGQLRLEKIIQNIKKKGMGKKYDCIIGVSGGTDSTYCLYLAKKWGLRPLAVHFDNGWNSEISVRNIKNATTKFDFDLYTWVADWEEFKDLQIAFLRASVPEADIPTDIAYLSVLYRTALTEDVKIIINGSNFRTEGKQPPAWGFCDGKYVQTIYKQFGKKKHLQKIPNLTLIDLFNYHLIRHIQFIKPLYYLDYNKHEAMKILESEIGWQYYGGHHFENVYTRFIHGYYLPKKFGIEKRIIEFSALIRSGQLERDVALERIKEVIYSDDLVEHDIQFIINKLNITHEEFEKIMNAPNRFFYDYKTNYPLIMKMKFLINVAYKLKLYPDKVYGKYSY